MVGATPTKGYQPYGNGILRSSNGRSRNESPSYQSVMVNIKIKDMEQEKNDQLKKSKQKKNQE